MAGGGRVRISEVVGLQGAHLLCLLLWVPKQKPLVGEDGFGNIRAQIRGSRGLEPRRAPTLAPRVLKSPAPCVNHRPPLPASRVWECAARGPRGAPAASGPGGGSAPRADPGRVSRGSARLGLRRARGAGKRRAGAGAGGGAARAVKCRRRGRRAEPWCGRAGPACPSRAPRT